MISNIISLLILFVVGMTAAIIGDNFYKTAGIIVIFISGVLFYNFMETYNEEIKQPELSELTINIQIENGDTVLLDTTYVYKTTLK